MDITYLDLWSAWPSCALCCYQDFSQSVLPYQFDCLHLYCQNCANECYQQNGSYYCPFDGQYTTAPHYNYDLLKRVNEISQSGNQLSKQAIGAHYWWLSQKINTANVPCRNFFVTNTCAAQNCRNSHEANLWQAYNCPAWDNCGRGHMCPFRHSWTPAYLLQTVSAPSAYTAAQPAYLQQVQATDYQYYGSGYTYESLLGVSSTVQAFQKQKILIRSASLLNALTANDSQLLYALAAQYQAQVSVTISKVNYMSRVRWVYYLSDQENNYNEYASQRLESAFNHQDFDTDLAQDAKVNFKVMVHITPNHYYKVARYEIVTNSTDAAAVDFQMYSDAEAFLTAVKSYEINCSAVPFQPCRDFVSIAKKYGIGVIQDKMFGVSADLTSATAEMQQVMMRQNQEIICQALPAGMDERTARMIAKDLTVAVYGNRVFGVAQDFMQFIWQIHNAYMSIPIPAGMSDEYIDGFCARNGLTRQYQYLFGTKENIAAAMAEMTESSTPIPPGTSEEKVQELIQTHGVRREGNFLIGQNQTMVLVVQALQNLEMSAAYPKHLLAPQVQAVCDRHNVRINDGKLLGAQTSVLAALNELNTIPAVTGFQYHQAPQWYANCPDQVVLVDLQPNDPEYTNVSNQFRQTTPNQITRIRVIQNKRLYTNFAFKHEGYSKVEGRAIEIKRLFHGTRANDPKTIYESDSGLDSRYGGGMWGNGTYYAFNSSYSTGYAHAAADGTKEMFLCEVIVGDYIQLPSDNTLKKPPLKPNSTSSYHSVKGNTGGSDIWITYEPAMSYPHFLINYR